MDWFIIRLTNFHQEPRDNLSFGSTEESDTMIALLMFANNDYVPRFLLWLKFPQFLPILTQLDLVLSHPTIYSRLFKLLAGMAKAPCAMVKCFLLECKFLGDIYKILGC